MHTRNTSAKPVGWGRVGRETTKPLSHFAKAVDVVTVHVTQVSSSSCALEKLCSPNYRKFCVGQTHCSAVARQRVNVIAANPLLMNPCSFMLFEPTWMDRSFPLFGYILISAT